MSFPRLPFLAAAALVLAVAGCKVETINDFPSKPASVRAINLVTDAATIDIKKDDTTVWSAIALAAPTDYQMFDNRQTNFDVFAPGVTSPIASVSGSLSANQTYTIVAYDRIAWAAAGLIAAGSLIGGFIGAGVGRKLSPVALRAAIVVLGLIALWRLLAA